MAGIAVKKIYFIFVFCALLLTPIAANQQYDDIPKDSLLNLNQDIENQQNSEEYSFEIDNEIMSDSAYAVDDELWRQMNLAQEYFTLGVAANQQASWEEAQYYLEKALSVLADLDIDSTTAAEFGPEGQKYESLLNQIVADYRLTLLSLGTLPEDASPSVFLEKFSALKEFGEIKTVGEKKPVTYNVPIVYNDRVKKSIIYFQTVAREAFETYLERSGKYIPMMKEILKEYDVPTDIVFLPLIESGFNCKAYSWARASGPWQFIASTGRLYGLNRNWWYDERRDFVKSTHAAAKFLKYLHDKFDCWELALAAYNGGPGRVGRTIKRQKTRNFWDMNLRKQTEDYVPFYMAATIIAKNPELYGFHIHYDDPIAYDEVKIKKCLDLKTVAKAVNYPKEVIEDLNPELLRGVTPPGVKSYMLRIPKGTKDTFLANLPDLESPQETSWVKHRINRGETVSTIAAKYGVSQYAIFEANNLSRRSRIYAGKYIIIPVPLNGSHSGSSRIQKRTANSDNTYVIQRGDNLWDIGRSFGTTPDKLRRLNYLGNSSRIYVGQVLKLPGSANSSSGSVARVNYDNQPAGETFSYKVRRGDTLWDIARKYGTTTAALRRLNGLNRSSRIYIGQTLLVGGNAGSSTGEIMVHTVRRGDTLSGIAKRYGTSVRSLIRLNNIGDASKLAIGMKIKIAR